MDGLCVFRSRVASVYRPRHEITLIIHVEAVHRAQRANVQVFYEEVAEMEYEGPSIKEVDCGTRRVSNLFSYGQVGAIAAVRRVRGARAFGRNTGQRSFMSWFRHGAVLGSQCI